MSRYSINKTISRDLSHIKKAVLHHFGLMVIINKHAPVAELVYAYV